MTMAAGRGTGSRRHGDCDYCPRHPWHAVLVWSEAGPTRLAAEPPGAFRVGRFLFVGSLHCDDPQRGITAARHAGADAEIAGDDVDAELSALQLVGDGSVAGRRLPAPTGDPGFQAAEPATVAQQLARLGLGYRPGVCTPSYGQADGYHRMPSTGYMV
jgi:hypothetical protein